MKRWKPTMLSRSTMKRKAALYLSTALLAGALLGFTGAEQAQAAQPHSSHWYPNTILNWSPQTDPDAPFNRSSVPLEKKRVQGDKVNPNAKVEPKVMALASMYKNTSGAPSQGNDNMHGYAFSYWQYVDSLIMWGGSAGEGLIVSPSADVIDAAHKNGVPVYGTVFLPQMEHGGKFQWTHDLLQQRPDGTFPVADKLIEVAKYYGFDGWFINEETQGGTPADAKKMQEFLKYLQKIKTPEMEVVWYDSMINDGPVRWQGALNDKNSMFVQDGAERVSDHLFIDFRWQYQGSGMTPFKKSPDVANQLGRSQYDLYAGIDVEAGGYQSKLNWPVLFPDNGTAVTSLGIYRPDWAFNSSKTNEQFMENEHIFWVGQGKDPSKTKSNGTAWRGIAHDIVDETVITDTDFTTHFNTGNGKMFSVHGQQVRDREWFNRSLQDILPTWRWMKDEQGQKIDAAFDFNKAYYGGSSLKLSGQTAPGASTNMKLYKTDVPVTKSTVMSITYQTNQATAADVNIGVAFEGAPNDYVTVKPKHTQKAGTAKDWTQATYDLKDFAGKKVVGMSVQVAGKQQVNNYELSLGEFAIRDHQVFKAPNLKEVKGLTIIDNDFRDGLYADARLKWDDMGDDVLYYQVYRQKPDGSREFMGATSNNYYYVSEMRRAEMEQATNLIVVPVNRHYAEGRTATAQFQWPAYPAPKADFEADKTYVAPGETIQLKDKSTEVTTEWLWSFLGGTPTSSTERNPQVKYEQEGEYEITLTAKNAIGQDVVTKKLITVDKAAENRSEDVAKGKKTTASSFVNAGEAPQFAVDGEMHTKWCAVGNAPHWMTVDLGGEFNITEFVVHHAQAGGESASFNTREFKIQLSSDGQTWTDAVIVKDNDKGTSKHAIGKTKARYAKLIVEKPTQGGDTAARIYGFEVKGIPSQPAQ
ncbi:discoidin domain-containing protein [Paenibacillus sp. SC116]|uniref:endo-beta-N-acetylglucosaminidase n=1 Tax=Paenibacillus sp. SC116 TaxID=2968986 RepID=UPI00215A1792|nr:discoidin domain-containing protein [Paenibacillus sp. SC116]MCR8845232.1 discoidin domain-containing protein [Paenibacillus sp. SC116]